MAFEYTVAEGDRDDNGINAFVPHGRDIKASGTDIAYVPNPSGVTPEMGEDPNHKVDGSLVSQDTTSPTVSSVAFADHPGPGDDDTYGAGDWIGVWVTFNESVLVAGFPQIELDIGGTARVAQYGHLPHGRSITPRLRVLSTTHTFGYDVREGDVDTDGIAIAADKITLNRGSIKDEAKNAAVLTHAAVADDPGHKANAPSTAPTVSSVSITSDPGDDDTYAVGDAIEVTVTFSENVRFVAPSSDSSGSTTERAATLELDIGGAAKSATYSSVSGSAMVFSYTVQGGDRDEDGVSIDADMLTVVSGSIEDTDGNAAEVAHQAVPTQAGHKVLGGYIVAENSPAGVSIGPPAGQGSYTLGGTDAASFSINAGTGQLLTSDPLDYETKNQYSVTVSDGDTATSVVIFVSNVDEPGVVTLSAYTHVVNTPLTATLSDPDGIVSGVAWQWEVSWYRPDGWVSIPWGRSETFTVDNTGTALGRLRVRVTYTDGHGPNKSALSDVSNDQDAPALYDVEITSNAGADNTYKLGDDIVVKAIFGEGVAVTGTPQLELNFGGQTRMANFDRVQIDPLSDFLSDVIFIYTVDEDDLSLNGVAIENNKLDLNGGAIKDFAYNDTTQTYSALATNPRHKVDGVRPTLLSAITSADGTGVTITFTEDVQISPLLDWFITQNSLLGAHLFVLSVLNVEVDEAWPMQTNATVLGNTVTVTMSAPITLGQDVEVRYDGVYAEQAPEILMDMAGNPMTQFGATAGTNASTVPADTGARGITMSDRELSITEGEGGSYTIALSAQPTGDVNVALTAVTPDNVTISAESLTFTTDNWNTPQTVQVSSDADDNDYGYWVTIVHTASGSGYAGQDAIKVLMTEE